MNLLCRTAMTLSVCLASASTALAQPAASSATLCGLYKQLSDGGKDAFTALRGEEVSTDTWALKGVVVEGGTCVLRSNVKKKVEALGCSFESAGAEDSKKWLDDMTAATRNCMTGLTGFVEKKNPADAADDKDKHRVAWVRKSDTGTVRVWLSTSVKDGKAVNRAIVHFAENP